MNIQFGSIVKLNADSEFLVHFHVGPQFRGLAHWDRVIYYEIIMPQILKNFLGKISPAYTLMFVRKLKLY
jgi:hypothetical protein